MEILELAIVCYELELTIYIIAMQVPRVQQHKYKNVCTGHVWKDQSSHVREPRTVLDSGFHARDSFRIPGIESRSMSVELGFRVPIFSDIRGSKPRIPVPRAKL